MRFNRFLLTTCASICLALPAISLADPPRDSDPQGDQQAHKPGKVDHGPGKTTPGHQGAAGERKAPGFVDRARLAPDERAAGSPVVRQPPVPRAPPALGGWNGNVRGSQRAQLGQQWRGQHQNWDQNAPWRGNHDWWRNYPSFRQFTGVRIGFFFFPDYGYVIAPDEYRERHWQAGEYLPRWFWRYSVREYANYGLPRPPDGCGWIWLNGNVALVDRSDGYIIDIVYNVW